MARKARWIVLAALGAAGCSGMQETWEGPGAQAFRPTTIAVLPPDASAFDGAREAVQEVLVTALAASGRFERVVPPEQVATLLERSRSAFDALVSFRSRLDTTGALDADAVRTLSEALQSQALLFVRVNAWEYSSRDGDKSARVGFTLRLVDASTGTLVARIRHEEHDEYTFFRPELRELGADLAEEMVEALPPH